MYGPYRSDGGAPVEHSGSVTRIGSAGSNAPSLHVLDI
jgi:hypothetical protein